MDKFNERLKTLRCEKHLTQKDLAKKIGTTDDCIFAWEKGKSQPSIEMIVKLCLEFSVSADYLLGITEY